MFFALLPIGRKFCEIPWSLSVKAKEGTSHDLEVKQHKCISQKDLNFKKNKTKQDVVNAELLDMLLVCSDVM